MNTAESIDRLAPASRKAFWLGFGLAFCVVILTVLAGAFYFRAVVRAQIASRDAEALQATTAMEALDVRSEIEGDLGEDQVGFEAALLASRLKGVMGIRFFDASGKFRDSFPANVQPRGIEPWARQPVRRMQPSSRFTPLMRMDEVFIFRPEFSTGHVARAPILEIVVPLCGRGASNSLGAAQFIVEGSGIASEYARLDRNLGMLAGAAALVAGSLLFGMLWPIFRKLERLNHEHQLRGERLLRANQELALAARTAALGAVSAHLMHGLKNPLASLAQYVQTKTSDPGGPEDEDSRDAIAATRRMQALVEETLEVISDARGGPAYSLTTRELLESLSRSFSPKASAQGVVLSVTVQSELPFSSRRANLARLVLGNLLDNAIQATPPGRSVLLAVEASADEVRFTVRDEGSGFPEHLRSTMFLPCKSTREGGGGVGLAISRRIADSLNAKLELRESSTQGCVFSLELPMDEESRVPLDRGVIGLDGALGAAARSGCGALGISAQGSGFSGNQI
jgi:signal transduction histidine kinase